MGRETSQILTKVFTELRAEGVGKTVPAQELGLSMRELDRLMFSLTIVEIRGGGMKEGPMERTKGSRLRVIK